MWKCYWWNCDWWAEKENEGDKVAVNFLCENAKGEIVIDVVVMVKDKIISEVECLRGARDLCDG